MKRCFAIIFLSVFLITYFIPVTSVFATEVTWGDDNNYYLTTNQYINCRKLATLNMITQLTSNGVNEISINNADSVDDFIVNFLEYIDENAESTVSDVYSVCNELKNAIDDLTDEIGMELKGIGTSIPDVIQDIDDWLDDNLPPLFYRVEYKPNTRFVPIMNRFSRVISNDNPSPTPIPQPSNIQVLLDFINKRDNTVANSFFFYDATGSGGDTLVQVPPSDYSWTVAGLGMGYDIYNQTTFRGNTKSTPYLYPLPIQNLYIYSQNNEYTFTHYVSPQYQKVMTWGSNWSPYGSYTIQYNGFIGIGRQDTQSFTRTSSGTLEQVLNYIKDYYKNVNIYVDGNLISGVDDSNIPQNILFNINGIDFYGEDNNQPIRYYYPHGTKIDYQKLYMVIKKAIDDLEPINQTTINQGDVYYDSHDNVYSPTIYNYYSDEQSENEEDVLSDILDLALIPKFDTALLSPIEEPITNGTVIMFAGAQVFPEDILFVLGAAFVLILFVAMINRLIE